MCSKQTRERGEKVKLKLFVILWGLPKRIYRGEKKRKKVGRARLQERKHEHKHRAQREMCVRGKKKEKTPSSFFHMFFS